MTGGVWTKVGAVTAAGVAVWTLARADAQNPGVVQNGVTSAAETIDATATGGIRIVKNAANEATSPVAPATATTVVAEGGDATVAK